MAEGARLERVWARKGLVGSNPTLSASHSSFRVRSVSVSICQLMPGTATKRQIIVQIQLLDDEARPLVLCQALTGHGLDRHPMTRI